MPITGMKMIAMIQAIAEDGLRFEAMYTPATMMISTHTTYTAMVSQVPFCMCPPPRTARHRPRGLCQP